MDFNKPRFFLAAAVHRQEPGEFHRRDFFLAPNFDAETAAAARVRRLVRPRNARSPPTAVR